ncbi:hypothetical protein [Cellulomonas fimi]|uniref:Uncharacterized protein n=1 Tax=Cellulomonas fimi (strain ATCC 484 / DSM 20113 / JCM 1341 / CCUG 24087 / LMG 16345 / NBRC 15513 / NCIMB 8980 / NCTC 7547 / NRS-133) TaxID=590998 RepID=F4H012_CELFA|nr:hypothetical protein [Cellulomonas fimi]AEE44934.1 hypothetical protein Celf_0794 [Cellulomonas fimi ATCC 484]NNH07243.1 hypothetical protein [Cellulomonas fimi]VEH27725.1 Uncharacterised protein [Cellulomonas fimi]
MRTGVDALHGLPFWLTTRCGGEQLWAANADHLDCLESFVGARHRVVEVLPAGREMGHRLPRWMLLGKHRAAVLTGLAELRERADALPACPPT